MSCFLILVPVALYYKIEIDLNSLHSRETGFSGYMAPEYAMDGQISIKSDVFSFGVLVLEIIAGRRNRGSYDPDLDVNLLGYVSSSS